MARFIWATEGFLFLCRHEQRAAGKKFVADVSRKSTAHGTVQTVQIELSQPFAPAEAGFQIVPEFDGFLV